MDTHPLTARNWLIVAGVAVVLGLLFVAPFLGVIALAALMAFLFYGTYNRLQRKMRAGGAATLTFLFSLAVVLIPVLLIGIFTAFQVGRLVVEVTNAFGGNFSSLPDAMQAAIAGINDLASRWGSEGQVVTAQSVLEFIKATLPGVLQAITGFLTGFVGGVPFMIILAIMYIFLFYEFLVYGKKIIKSIVALSPFQPEVTRMYLSRVGLMANAMAKGQLVMSVIIAVLEAVALAFFFGWWDYFLLMSVVFTVFNLIPLGAGIVAFPLIFGYMLFGSLWPAIGALIVISAVSNLESFLRPRFIPKSITLSNGLTMLSAFGGIALFGLLGVVYGPIIMIIIVTSVQMYLEYYDEQAKAKKKSAKVA